MAIEPSGAAPPESESSRWDQLERKEGQLWSYALWLGLLLAVAWAGAEWERLRALPMNLMGIPRRGGFDGVVLRLRLSQAPGDSGTAQFRPGTAAARRSA